MAKYTPIQPVRIGDKILDQIRARLSAGKLVAGDRLPSERYFAEQLGVSRNSVREALRVLETLGVVTIQKGHTGGAFVSQGDPNMLAAGLGDLLRVRGGTAEHITEARVWIEDIIVRVACERRTEADLDKLKANVQRLEDAVKGRTRVSTSTIAIEFHNLLAQCTKNTLLILVMGTIMGVISDIARAYAIQADKHYLRLMQRVVTAVEARDANAAADAMNAYLTQVDARYKSEMGDGSASPSAAVQA